MDENALSHRILGAAIEVHRVLGPGLLESVYEEALAMELIGRGIEISRQAEVALEYKGQKLQSKLRLDMVAADLVIVEVKSLDRLTSVHEAQLLTYLRLSRKKLGLLINFNTPVLKNSVRRVVNNL